MTGFSKRAPHRRAPAVFGGLVLAAAMTAWPVAASAREACPAAPPPMAVPPGFDSQAYQAAYKSPPAEQVRRALIYLYGPPEGRAPEAGVALLCAAAKAGSGDAMLRLTMATARGEGVRMDKEEAERWLRAAADAGQPRAMTTVGLAYAQGHYGEGRDAEAVAWYRKAADKGDPWAWLYLGDFYAAGRGGLPRDAAKGLEYRLKAVSMGDPAFLAKLRQDGRSAPDWAAPK